jgi:hypothetical protein
MHNRSRYIIRSLSLCGLLLSLILSSFILLKRSPDENNGYKQIFDGKSLEGWEGDSTYWSVEDGCIVGKVTPETLLKRNTFLIWRGGVTTNFDLRVEYRISKDGNSGINYRSEELKDIPYTLKGYQADIDGANQYTGQNYEERGRCILAFRGQQVMLPIVQGPFQSFVKNNVWTPSIVTGALGTANALKSYIHEGWNEYHLIVSGNKMKHYINDVLMSEVTDSDTDNRKFSGLLGVQVHVGPPMKVEYRNFRLKKAKL